MKIIGVELRLAIQEYVGGQRQDELMLIPLNIPLPRHLLSFSMPCTVHTDRGDLNLGGVNGQQVYYPNGNPEEGVTAQEYLADLARIGLH